MQLIGPFKELLPMTGLPLKGALKDSQLPLLKDAGILIDKGKIHQLGSFEALRKEWKDARVEETEGDMVVLPGFVDSHTHICFGGSRARDYALRNSGSTYLEIARAGGGIWDTVTQTRNSGREELSGQIVGRANNLLAQGITTVEVKSGYGLSTEEEIKMLEAIQLASADTAIDLIPTCLAAHMLPRDFNGTAMEYLEYISRELFPILKSRGLASRIDAFVEESAFSPEQIRPYFKKAREMGFQITVHADQFSTGGSAVAVEFSAISADHLEASGPKEIELLAKSNVIATALPGASLGLGCGFTPARRLLDAGAALAIASDWNPGSAPMGQLLTQAAILGSFEKLSNAEVLSGITFRAAAALSLKDRGRLEQGCVADFLAFSVSDYREILYRQGSLIPARVWKAGKIIST